MPYEFSGHFITQWPHKQRTGRILIVEDEPDLAEMLEHSLQQAGFETLSSADGFCACRLIERERPDVVLLDIMLPELDGWEDCRLLHSVPDESTATTPVIMLTALDALEKRVRGIELGADAYVIKPYASKILFSTCQFPVTIPKVRQPPRTHTAPG